MRTKLLAYAETIRASYWFIPTLMSLAAIVMSAVMTTIDARLGADWIDQVYWIHANKPDGARLFLSTIAGSMITVAGVVFSITIAAVSYASAQYGPRLLTNFLRDRGNQFSLGTFIATFIYCLLVLRTIRSADESSIGLSIDQESTAGAFTPNISVLIAIGLALCSIAVLIYFVHHVARSIHISHVVADIGHELRRHIEELFPEDIGTGGAELEERPSVPADLPEYFQKASPKTSPEGSESKVQGVATISAAKIGFVQGIDAETLLEIACCYDLVVRLECHPGDFLQETSPVISVWPRYRLADDAIDSLRATIIAGQLRTPVQDVSFLFEQLVEIAVRALSPGVNDPFTAKSCLNWLGAAIEYLSRRTSPDPYRIDAEHNLRVVAYPKEFDEFVKLSLGQMVPYVARDVNVSIHLIDTIGQVGVGLQHDKQRDALRELLSSLVVACERNLSDIDGTRVAEHASQIGDLVDRPMFGSYVGEPLTQVASRS